MLKFLTNFLILLFVTPNIYSQTSEPELFQSPLKIPLYLSGNFGELRSTHFHAGVDFKTQSEVGQPVLAAADGYVSRIKIQAGGYGQALYVDHPNGYTTVYAHLDSFLPEIEKYVKEIQYKKQSFEVDLTIPSGKFVFKKGDLMAYSGNTGRSGGPHLHFEIRKTSSQVPQNGLLFNFSVKDKLPPEFRSVVLYAYRNAEPNAIQCNRQLINPLVKKSDTLYSLSKEVLIDGAYLGIGTEIYDFLDGSSNKCGVYSMSLYIDNEMYYAFEIDEISFSKTRFINAHMDYDLKVNSRKSVHRLFALPYNELPIYSSGARKGIYPLKDYETHKAKIVAEDAYGNRSVLTFSFRRKKMEEHSFFVPQLAYLVEWDKGRSFDKEGLRINIPAKAFYQDVNFNYSLAKGGEGIFDDTIRIHESNEALHRAIKVSYQFEAPVDSLKSKLIFGRLNGKNKLVSGGGEYVDGGLTMSTRSFGTYMVCMDTIAPVITYGGYSETSKKISFKISDDFSGVKEYNGYVDGQWALFKFDSKSGKLVYEIDSEKVKSGGKHTLKLIVSDQKDNESIYEGSFSY